jgi:L-lactate utilization protein LutC
MDSLNDRIGKNLAGGPKREDPGPLPPGEREGSLEKFTEALERVAGRVARVADEKEARAWLEREYEGRRVVFAEDDPDEAALREAEVGVDRADLLLAETGTVLKTYPSRGASRISLVPEVSVFLADADDLVAGYAEAIERVADRHRDGPAYTVLITGPSRTADIEKELVIPAHGPRELTVVVMGEER